MSFVFLVAAITSVAGFAAAFYLCMPVAAKPAASLPAPAQPQLQPEAPNLALIERLQVLMRVVRDNVEEHSQNVSSADASLRTLQQGSPSAVMSEVAEVLDVLLEKNARLQQRLQMADRELSRQSELLQEQREAALTDPLTGLANRRAFDNELARLMSESTPIGIVMLDLDDFKRVNDVYGHAAGDAVLVEVAAQLCKGVRQEAFVARLGGEEFAVLVPNATDFVLSRVSLRLRGMIQSGRVEHEGQTISVTSSFGAAIQQPDEDVAALCKRADAATYASKGAGRNCCHLHTGARIEKIEPAPPERPCVSLPPWTPLASRIELMARIRRHFLEADLQANPLTLVLLEIEGCDAACTPLPIDHVSFRQALNRLRTLLRAEDLIAESDPYQAALLLPGAACLDAAGPLERLAAALDDWAEQSAGESKLHRGISRCVADDDWVSFVRRAESDLADCRSAAADVDESTACATSL